MQWLDVPKLGGSEREMWCAESRRGRQEGTRVSLEPGICKPCTSRQVAWESDKRLMVTPKSHREKEAKGPRGPNDGVLGMAVSSTAALLRTSPVTLFLFFVFVFVF